MYRRFLTYSFASLHLYILQFHLFIYLFFNVAFYLTILTFFFELWDKSHIKSNWEFQEKNSELWAITFFFVMKTSFNINVIDICVLFRIRAHKWVLEMRVDVNGWCCVCICVCVLLLFTRGRSSSPPHTDLSSANTEQYLYGMIKHWLYCSFPQHVCLS